MLITVFLVIINKRSKSVNVNYIMGSSSSPKYNIIDLFIRKYTVNYDLYIFNYTWVVSCILLTTNTHRLPRILRTVIARKSSQMADRFQGCCKQDHCR